MQEKIFVTKSFFPDKSKYFAYLENIFDNNLTLTNCGQMVVSLEQKLKEYLNVPHLDFVTNGTIALQLALDAYNLEHCEIVTTPFSYVATVNSILWQKCKPVFVDIEPNNFTIDTTQIESKITPQTKAILAVHVFGYACDTDKIKEIAAKHNLKVIYDGAHAFSSVYKEKSLLAYGDITTCSFHATKLFHTVEGGAVITSDSEIAKKINLTKRFGHYKDEYFCIGINGKQSEFHAAMGLCNLEYMPEILEKRQKLAEFYRAELFNYVAFPKDQKELQHNYAYFPVLFKNEQELLMVFSALADENIFPRRYFYPSLNTLPFLEYQACPVSENTASRIACLPFYPQLSLDNAYKICQIIKKNTK